MGAVVRMHNFAPGIVGRPAAVRRQAIQFPQFLGPHIVAGCSVPFPSAGARGIQSQPETLLALTHRLPRPLAIPAIPLDHPACDYQQDQEAAASQLQEPSKSHVLSVGRFSPVREHPPIRFFHGTQHGPAFVHDPLALASANHSQGSLRSLQPAQFHGFSEFRKLRIDEALKRAQHRLLGVVSRGQFAEGLPDCLLLSKSGLKGLSVTLVAGKQVTALSCFGVLEVRQHGPRRANNLIGVRHPPLAVLVPREIAIQQARKDDQHEEGAGEQDCPQKKRPVAISIASGRR
jgi:hypothetical protein